MRLKLIFLLFLAGATGVNAVSLCDFVKEREPVPVWQGKKLEQSATYEKNGLRVRWNTARNNMCIFGEPWRKTQPLDAFKEAVCHIELEVPEHSNLTSFRVRFIDAQKEVFQWGCATNLRKAGTHRISIPMTRKNFQGSFRGNNDKTIDFPIRFYSCVATARKNSGEASILVKKIEYEPTLPDSDLSLVQFDLETGTVPRVLRKGEESKWKILLRNPGSAPLPCRAKIEFRDFQDNVLREETDITLPANGVLKYPPKTRLPRLGHWRVRLRLETPDASASLERERSLAYMVPAGPGKGRKDGFVFGICIPGWYDETIFPLEAETAALCGASALRLNFRWRELERTPDTWHLALLNRIMQEYESRGMELMPILSNPPVWARKNTPNSLPDFEQWRKYTAFFFRNYGERIRFWEIWNVPDLNSFCEFGAPDYVALQKIAREEQKRWAPHSRLLTGGFAYAYPDNNKNGFQEYVLAHGKEYFDIHAFHGHGNFKSYRRQIEQFLLPMRKRNRVSAPWFANETAVSALGIGEKEQAETLFKKLLFSWSAGAVGYNWYNLRNNGFLADNPEHHYGLVSFDFYPKPVYVVYNTLATVFRNMEFVRRHTKGDAIWILEFAGGGNRAVALWNDSPETVPDETAVFRSNAKSLEGIDLMGNASPLPHRNDLVELQITREPRILLFRECSNLQYLGSSAKGWITGGAVPGIPAKWNLSLFNPSAEQRLLRLKLEHGRSIRTGTIPTEVTLKPGERKRISAEVSVVEEKAGSDKTLKLNLSSPAHHFQLRFPMRWTVFIPREKKENQWDFVLNRRDQVHALFDADPGNLHRLWSGPEDLSAGIRMKVEKGIWILHFAVTDDRHVQPYRGREVWKGDNIQIAFRISGQTSLWTAGLTLLDSGMTELFLWDAPKEFLRQKPLKKWKLTAHRSGKRTEYELRIPLASIGLSSRLLKEGIRFNALINDNDTFGREGWIQITNGIDGYRSSDFYPLLIFESEQPENGPGRTGTGKR